jgi:predicted transcriptional regulator
MTAATERVPETTLIQFEIKDQFDRPHSERELQDRHVLLLCGDRKGSQYQGQWAAALRDSLRSRGRLESTTLIEIADLRGVPFFVKGSVKKKFPRDEASWVLMDWKGRFATAYGFEKDKCNIVLFDHSGMLVHEKAVEDLSLAVLQEILHHAEAIGHQGSTP